jgi:hypothetical protein
MRSDKGRCTAIGAAVFLVLVDELSRKRRDYAVGIQARDQTEAVCITVGGSSIEGFGRSNSCSALHPIRIHTYLIIDTYTFVFFDDSCR